MKTLDLTHCIRPDMPVYPGTEPPTFAVANDYQPDLFRETLMTMYSHTGTHMDAPAHILPGRRWLNHFPAEHFTGTALAIDCTALQPGEKITAAQLAPVADLAEQADYLLFYTGWDRYWGKPEYFGSFPCLDPALAGQIAEMGKKGVGIDTISIDPVNSLAAHRALFAQHDLVIVENLTNLDKVGAGLFSLLVLPLFFENADGAPVRAIAQLKEEG